MIDGDTFLRQKLSHQSLIPNTLFLFFFFLFYLDYPVKQTGRGLARSGRRYFRYTIKTLCFKQPNSKFGLICNYSSFLSYQILKSCILSIDSIQLSHLPFTLKRTLESLFFYDFIL